MKGHTRRIRNALSEKGYIEEWESCFTAFRIIFVEESNDMKKKNRTHDKYKHQQKK